MRKKVCPTFEMLIFAAKLRLAQLCIQDTIFFLSLHLTCHSDISEDWSQSIMTEHNDGLFLIGASCWFWCLLSSYEAGAFVNLRILQSYMEKDLITSDLAKLQLTRQPCREQMKSEISISLKILLSIWFLLHKKNVLLKILVFMADSTQ